MTTMSTRTSLPPIFYHFFRSPLPYAPTLELQNLIHGVQLARRRDRDRSPSRLHEREYLLLLEHRPVFTAGRRQRAADAHIQDERARLRAMGADFECTLRGGELTYHGPGQLVGYPLLDLGRSPPSPGAASMSMSMSMSIREYICRLQQTIQEHLLGAHGIRHVPSENTGVFVGDGDDDDGADGGGRGTVSLAPTPKPKTKIASIGVQVRHRLTTHGFAMNVTREPLAWFDNIVACGLADVKAGSIVGRSKSIRDRDRGRGRELEEAAEAEANYGVPAEVPGIVEAFGRVMQRDMVALDLSSATAAAAASDSEVTDAIAKLEEEARVLQRERPCPRKPLSSS